MDGAQPVGLSDRLLKEEYLRRLQEEGLRFYKPHAAQIDFHKSLADVRLLLGSNQCGKSYALRAEIAWAVGKIHPHRANYIGPVYARHCCADFQVMSSVVIPGYRALLPRKPCTINGLQWPGLQGGSWESAWSAEGRTIFLADGSLIEFKSYDQDVLSYAGPPRHIVGHDEEPPQRLREENVARQATTGRNELFAFTPLNYSQWIYTLIEKGTADGPVGVFRMSMYDNPHIAVETIKSIEESITDPAERAARIYGEPTFVEGRVWKEYGEHNLCDPFELPQHWDRTVIIDPHPEKATGVNAVATDPLTNRSYVYYEANIKGDVEFISNQIKAALSGQFVGTWLIDPSSRAKGTIYGMKDRLLDEFRKYIPYLIEANNNVDTGREAVRDLIKNNPTGGPRLKVFRSCPTTDFQLRNHSWKPPTASGENRNHPEVVKRFDEHCDCIRYFAMHNRQFIGGETFGGFNIRMGAQ